MGDTGRIPQALRAAARGAVAADPNVVAVLLYGSRARGNHRPDSDWDIAVLTRRGRTKLRSRTPAGWGTPPVMEDCSFLRIPEGVLRARKDAVGHPAFAPVRDGVLLAGAWRRPMAGTPVLRAEEYAGIIATVLRDMGGCVYRSAWLPEDLERAAGADLGDCGDIHFLPIAWMSGWAASGLAMAALARHGKPGTRKRPPEYLAERLPDPVLAAEVAALGGRLPEYTEDLAADTPCSVRDLEAAVRRVGRAALRLHAELLAGARDPRLGRRAVMLALGCARSTGRWARALRKTRQTMAEGLPGGVLDEPARQAYEEAGLALEEAARRLASVPGAVARDRGVLQAFSDGCIGRGEAMRLLGLRDYAGLLVSLGGAGLTPPWPSEEETGSQAVLFERVWKTAATPS